MQHDTYKANGEPPIQTQEQRRESEPAALTREQIQQALEAAQGLALLRDLLQREPAHQFLRLLQTLTAPEPDAAASALSYSLTWNSLAKSANEEASVPLADAWQRYLITSLIDNRNPWSTQVERVGRERVSPQLRIQGQRELRALQRLFQLHGEGLLRLTYKLVTPTLPELRDAWTAWLDLQPQPADEAPSERDLLAAHLAGSTDWTHCVDDLEHYWARHGTGELARYRVLQWQASEQRLLGISSPDPIQLTQLIGQERQQERLSRNIERFLARLPSQDMLLYGPPGTGKSSTVKALVNAYAGQGLRLVEISKEHINDLPMLLADLSACAPRYLIFIDDLSFEEQESSYKALKVILEGTAAARPSNILICATSNRLNLIRENFEERGKASTDINWRDTMDEKQSLAQRFGLRVTFLQPDQRAYMQIIAELARQRQLELSQQILQERALQWERQHSGRSGRVARQFIDDLEGEFKSH